MKLVFENQMYTFFKMLSGFVRCVIEFESGEVYIFSGHEFYELIKVDFIFLCSSQSENNLGLIFTYIVAVLSYDFLQLLDTYFSVLGILAKILSEMPTLFIVLYECMLQLIQLEHIDIFASKLIGDALNILVEMRGVVELRHRGL